MTVPTEHEASFEDNSGARHRGRKKLWLSLAAASLVVLLCCGGGAFYVVKLALTSGSDSEENMAGCGSQDKVKVSGSLPEVRSLNKEQMGNAAIIVQVGQNEKISPRGWLVAIATAMQESTLHNYDNLGGANDHDSLGLFQQRPSMGWGSPEQITTPEYAAKKFYSSLKKLSGWESMPITKAAQQVQKSAFPDAYAKWEPLAADVVNGLTKGGARTSATSGKAGTCASATQIAASGWTSPVKAGIVSQFRPPDRPDHYGVDLGAPRGTKIHVAASGTVVTAECNAFSGGAPYSCDKDGSPAIMGCGWYVDVKHADDIITRYCHMQEKPHVKVGQKVDAGQELGISGTSGNSSGPHVHFEVHTGGDQSNGGAVEPIAFMKQQGVTLGKK